MPATSNGKWIVYVNAFGGMDTHFMVQPTDVATNDLYELARPTLTETPATLAATALTPKVGGEAVPSGRTYALHVSADALLPAWNAEKMAVIQNTGLIHRPIPNGTTPGQYFRNNVDNVRGAFDHDLMTRNNLGLDRNTGLSGFGGRIAQIVANGQLLDPADGVTPLVNTSPSLSSISLNNSNAFSQPNGTLSQYVMSTNGPQTLLGAATTLNGSSTADDILRQVMGDDNVRLQAKEHGVIWNRSQSALTSISSALTAQAVARPIPVTTHFSATNWNLNQVAAQLCMIARMIDCSVARGEVRGVYFAGLGGFDDHQNLLTGLPGRITTMCRAIAFFRELMVAWGYENQVVLVLTTEFNRTFTINPGLGTDHAYGGMNFLFGPVNGKKFYGIAQAITADSLTAVGGPDESSAGRFVPTTSSIEWCYEICRWFGLTDAQTKAVLPEFVNFESKPRLGIIV